MSFHKLSVEKKHKEDLLYAAQCRSAGPGQGSGTGAYCMTGSETNQRTAPDPEDQLCV